MEEALKNARLQESRSLNEERKQVISQQQDTIEDNSPEAIQMRQFQTNINNSEAIQQELAFQEAIHQYELEQQTDTKPNTTGLPDDLKTGMENLSGISLDDVKVHYNVKEPEQVNAHAHTEGNDIYIAPGQEKHLPEELGHAVQQKTQRIQTTKELNGETPINDDKELEQEAIMMGQHALKATTNQEQDLQDISSTSTVIQRREKNEDPSLMETIYKSKSKRIGSRSVFLTDAKRKPQLNNRAQPRTKKLSDHNTLELIDTVQDPEGLPPGNYSFVKFMDIVVSQTEADKINLNWQYGYARDADIEAMGSYKNINTIPANPDNPKQGKILPAQGDPPISQNDVYQSTISDCYLHAALMSIVSANPDTITNLFDIQENAVTINFPGTEQRKPLTVNMSKKLFLTPEGEPLYGGKKDSYLWPAFIQKAWAIYKGKYNDLPMGTAVEIIAMITGRETSAEVISDNSAEKAWWVYNKIVEAITNNKPAILSTRLWTDTKTNTITRQKKNVFPSKRDHGGLGVAHIYSIQGMSNLALQRPESDPTATPDAVLTLRDPRTKDGSTFELPFMTILDKRKIQYVSSGV